ncbi:hypothetical protein BDV41DRAFT_412498 [Aspergillus transmontanensis]|uniref:Uncharacterized protein n=1 Tax=Aspergillus transmontanensis TaxID=1034304 RepID=A0A5N6WE90_9EURO|nr:hypothetical protein BDV41DRAFT_412498 [Aspergillus transmontanensis]
MMSCMREKNFRTSGVSIATCFSIISILSALPCFVSPPFPTHIEPHSRSHSSPTSPSQDILVIFWGIWMIPVILPRHSYPGDGERCT